MVSGAEAVTTANPSAELNRLDPFAFPAVLSDSGIPAVLTTSGMLPVTGTDLAIPAGAIGTVLFGIGALLSGKARVA